VTTAGPTAVDISRPLLRYRIAAYTVGVMLLVACAASFAKHALDGPDFLWVWFVHGYFYLVYLGLAFDLFRRVRWPLPRLFEMLVAGLLPGLTFVIERDISRYAAAHPPARQAPPAPQAS
jgi:integral membrane protein